MKPDISPSTPLSPSHWASVLEAPQSPVKDLSSILAWVELDLDGEMRFEKSLLCLIPAGLFWADGTHSEFWPISSGAHLLHGDHAGVGHLKLESETSLLRLWHFTLAVNPQVLRLQSSFRQLMQGDLATQEPEVSEYDKQVCPVCLSPKPANSDACPICDPEEDAPPSTWILLKLWRFARPYKKELLLGFVLTLLSTGATLIPPYLTMPLMDHVLIPYEKGNPIDFDLATKYLLALLAAAIVAWGLGWWKTYSLALVSERIGADLRNTTFEHLLKLSLEYFGGKRTGDLIARIGAESDRICVFLSLYALDFATDVIMITMTAAILVSIDPLLALVTLAPLPFIVWMIHVVRDKLRFGFEKIDRVWSEVTNILADTIPGIRVVKAFAQEDRELKRFVDSNKHNLQINDRVNRVWGLFSPTVTLLTETGLLVVWGFGIWQVAHQKVTVGVLIAFLAYIGRFYIRLDSMSRIVSHTQKAAAGAKRIFDILDHVSSVPEPINPAPLGDTRGRISLRGVGFRYGNRAVSKGIDLDIAPGEMIGLVGHSGSGKSTLVNLICRFYDVSAGSITLDGRDIRSIRIADYRKRIGLVLQEPFLFFGTIAENIAYGKPEATREEIIEAARAAHAHEFILRLPLGYDSLVGERGQSLSGGERQRISIARALLINPSILILDEATSSVDTTTEKEIQRALDNLVKGRTTIAIAHRLSTLRKADRLVVLDKGEIVEIGSHDELMDAQGAYYALYQAQLRHAAELVEGGAIGESIDEGLREKEGLQMIAKETGGGV
ncbi:ABC transporter ATP-binding protein [Polynucleobacter sp. UK-Mo-2m-Kol15]|uniref:cyanophycin metabolism-associated ABC transporter n=1 Tax=Polynucleobacter sp. UK-Mo-2m-Kol15 TaxID=2576916 RepID=UPI001C0DAACD|nr:ABC transporter ATP-binding protein [Polynucleobacter sp. UK-Mo-2m-Kol15]MBU3576098.1 ABC transporter ATP-binding protein [Polynucleobacter sp. UK-Mo-2m-Kol15]